MKKLSNDWFVEGTLDFEYKKYILLAYLQAVSKEFDQVKLYPSLQELIHHYKNLASFQETRQQIMKPFPSKLTEEELKKIQLVSQADLPAFESLKEVEAIVEYALPNIKHHIKEGKGIYDFIESHLLIEPIGISPLYKKEGYVFIRVNKQNEISAFEYKIVFFENIEANYQGLSLKFIDNFALSLVNTYENIKRKLIKTRSKFPNPATFLIFSKDYFPLEASLLPVAKRKFLAYMK
jgi:hypothetical protein